MLRYVEKSECPIIKKCWLCQTLFQFLFSYNDNFRSKYDRGALSTRSTFIPRNHDGNAILLFCLIFKKSNHCVQLNSNRKNYSGL